MCACRTRAVPEWSQTRRLRFFPELWQVAANARQPRTQKLVAATHQMLTGCSRQTVRISRQPSGLLCADCFAQAFVDLNDLVRVSVELLDALVRLSGQDFHNNPHGARNAEEGCAGVLVAPTSTRSESDRVLCKFSICMARCYFAAAQLLSRCRTLETINSDQQKSANNCGTGTPPMPPPLRSASHIHARQQ